MNKSIPPFDVALCKAQVALHRRDDGVSCWLGNRVSDVRFYLWKWWRW